MLTFVPVATYNSANFTEIPRSDAGNAVGSFMTAALVGPGEWAITREWYDDVNANGVFDAGDVKTGVMSLDLTEFTPVPTTPGTYTYNYSLHYDWTIRDPITGAAIGTFKDVQTTFQIVVVAEGNAGGPVNSYHAVVTYAGGADEFFLENDTVALGNGDDYFADAGGELTLTAGAGNDTLIIRDDTDSMPDYVDGGDGNDVIVYSGFGDVLFGGAGDDHFIYDPYHAQANNYETIFIAGEGNDDVTGAPHGNAFFEETGSGNDVYRGTASASYHDVLDYSAGASGVRTDIGSSSAVNTGAYGNDLFLNIDNVVGTGFNDTILGSGGANQLSGGNGLDVIDGRSGADVLDGGGGNDTLQGAQGDDILLGSDGNDTLRGGSGADLLDGGAGSADLADYLSAGAGVAAALDGAFGLGEAQGDTYKGIERLRGTNFADRLGGDAAANFIFGQNGADTLEGGAGADLLSGGAGADKLLGGTGADRFEYAALSDCGDAILDFGSPEDFIVVSASGFGAALSAGTLGAEQFQVSASLAVANAAIRFIFNSSNASLWFDQDGNGSAAAILVADLQTGATMTNTDILIV